MPSAYDGNPVGVQAPDVAPEPEKPPKLNLPVDGDPLNVSSIYQALKTLADHVAWSLVRRAKSGVYQGGFIERWKTAIGHSRFAVDHFGFPCGQLQGFDWSWVKPISTSQFLNNTGPADILLANQPEWRFTSANSTLGLDAQSVRVDVLGIGGGQPGSAAFLTLRSNSQAGDYAMLTRAALGLFSLSNQITFETVAILDLGTLDARNYYVGLGTRPAGAPSSTLQNFVGFRKLEGTANWQCVTMNGGAATVTTTGTPPSATDLQRLRIEWDGSGVADDATSRARFYINGALVATHTANLPISQEADVILASNATSGASDATALLIGPGRVRSNIVAIDAVH